MDIVFTSFFWTTLAQVMVVSVLLSGSNAMVIQLASRTLPRAQQTQAVLIGNLVAVVARIVLALLIVFLLDVPFFQIAGALLLVWAGIRLLVPEREDEGPQVGSAASGALKPIIVAGIVMSLHNVLAVAAAAQGNVFMIVIGLAVSIALVLYGGSLARRLMVRYGYVATVAAGLLGWLAGEMLIADPAIKAWIDIQVPWAHTAAPVLGMAVVVVSGMMLANRAGTERAAVGPAPIMTTLGGGPNDAQLVHAAAASSGIGSGVTRQSSVVAAGQGAGAGADTVVANREPALPPGYRQISRRWRTLPNGRRDYAAMHGLKSFTSAVPISGRLRPPPHRAPGKSRSRH